MQIRPPEGSGHHKAGELARSLPREVLETSELANEAAIGALPGAIRPAVAQHHVDRKPAGPHHTEEKIGKVAQHRFSKV